MGTFINALVVLIMEIGGNVQVVAVTTFSVKPTCMIFLYFEGQIEKQKKAFYSTTMLQTINTQETIHIDYTLDNVLMG